MPFLKLRNILVVFSIMVPSHIKRFGRSFKMGSKSPKVCSYKTQNYIFLKCKTIKPHSWTDNLTQITRLEIRTLPEITRPKL